MSFLPNGNNTTILTSQLYARKPSEVRPASVGLTQTFTFTPTNEVRRLENNNDGASVLVAERGIQRGATVSITADEITARNLAFYMLGDAVAYTQSAATGEALSESDIVAGQITALNGRNATNIALTDDAAAALVEGVDYTHNAAAGYLLWLRDMASASGTYDLPAMTDADNVSTIDLLSRLQGEEVYLTALPTNDGPKIMVENVLVRLNPTGSMSLIDQGNNFATIEFEGTARYDATQPNSPFGRVTHLPG